MAVKAQQQQHGVPDLRPLPNHTVLERFGDVENQPTSHLTCNSSASFFKKRSRNNFQTDFSQQYEAIPDLFTMQHQSRVYESVCISASGRTSAAPEVGGLDLSSQLHQQGLEIDAIVRFQIERMQKEVELVSKRHCLDLQSVLGQRIKDREAELERASRRHAELEQEARQLAAESQIWSNVAKNYEFLVGDLRLTLERTLLQNTVTSAPEAEFGDSFAAQLPAEDAESCCQEGLDEARQTSNNLRRRRACRVCGEKEVCVLILPCRHLCFCKDCEPSYDTCPVCHTNKNASIQILPS